MVDLALSLAEAESKGLRAQLRGLLQEARASQSQGESTAHREGSMAGGMFHALHPEGRTEWSRSGCQYLGLSSISEFQLKCTRFLFNCLKIEQSFHLY